MDRYEVIEDEFVEDSGNDTEQVILACRYGDVDEADLRAVLESSPSLVDCVDDQGRTPMHMAAANGHVWVVRLLIDMQARPNVPNQEGYTALHYAASNNHCDVARALLGAGWSPAARDRFGKAPYQLIMDKQFDEMAAILDAADDTVDTYVPASGAALVIDPALEAAAEPTAPNASATGSVSAPAQDVAVDQTSTSLTGGAALDDIE